MYGSLVKKITPIMGHYCANKIVATIYVLNIAKSFQVRFSTTQALKLKRSSSICHNVRQRHKGLNHGKNANFKCMFGCLHDYLKAKINVF